MDNEDEYSNDVEGLTVATIELIMTIMTKESLYMLVKFAIFPVLNSLSHFMLFTKD